MSYQTIWRNPFQHRNVQPNIACSKFLPVTTENGGLGHRVGAIVVALHIASIYGVAVALDDAIWLRDRLDISI